MHSMDSADPPSLPGAPTQPSPTDLVEIKRQRSGPLLAEFESRNPALRHWLQQRWPKRRNLRVCNVALPPTGGSSETFFFDADWTDDRGEHRERLVLRREPADAGIFPLPTSNIASGTELQFRVQQALGQSGEVPVPPLVGFEADSAVLGRPFFVMGYVEGRIPADTNLAVPGWYADELSSDQRRDVFVSGLGALAALHRLDWRGRDLDGLDASCCGLPSTAALLRMYRACLPDLLAGRAHPVLYQALDWLEKNDPRDPRVGICWGDARLGNMIFRDLRPVALMDWEGCSLGPTEADVGWLLFIDDLGTSENGGQRLDGQLGPEELVAEYTRLSGRRVTHPNYWRAYTAMRLAYAYIRVVDRIASSGIVAPEMATDNFATRYLSEFGIG